MAGLQKEIWVAGIKENPVPDHSFVAASTDMSEYVENNKLHLAEAGLEPAVLEDYFVGNEADLPTATIADVPSEVVLRTYSTEQTRHRDLQEVELQYNRRDSIIKRHASSLAKNIGKRAAFAWSPQAANAFNKVVVLGASDKVIDAIIDMQLFYAQLDKTEEVNICLTPEHMAKLRKENLQIYKEIMSEKGANIYGFKVYSYSNCPLYTSAGVKKPFGAVAVAGDKRASFTWCTDETFRCFGDVNVYEKLSDPGSQADNISYAQRALVGNIRASNPKYLGAIV
ncbi:hypothetical protein [Flavobacterium sp.]|uniref:hypothetical protein n=1 Tax=Flavobacterium sp. TaxID=239 RepID=UPI00375222E7